MTDPFRVKFYKLGGVRIAPSDVLTVETTPILIETTTAFDSVGLTRMSIGQEYRVALRSGGTLRGTVYTRPPRSSQVPDTSVRDRAMSAIQTRERLRDEVIRIHRKCFAADRPMAFLLVGSERGHRLQIQQIAARNARRMGMALKLLRKVESLAPPMAPNATGC